MNAPVNWKVLLASAVLSFASINLGIAQDFYPAIYVDVNDVGGLVNGRIPDGGTITIPIRFINVDEPRTVICNGYRFYSDNVTWTDATVEWNSNYPWGDEQATALGCIPPECWPYFDAVLLTETYFDGPPADTVGFVGLSIFGALPVDFNDVAYTITVAGINGDLGELLTLDSTWWVTANYWQWSGVGDQVWWGGPYEFEMGPAIPVSMAWVDPSTVGGLTDDGKIPIGGTDLTIPIRFTNTFEPASTILNGFALHSDNVEWREVAVQWNSDYPWDYFMATALGAPDPFFDYGVYVNDRSLDGSPADTVSLCGFASSSGGGLPYAFDDVAYTLTIKGVAGDAGDTLILDSTSWAPARNWMWSGAQQEVDWGGPYVFEVESPDPPYTTCWPQPTILKYIENDGLLNVSVHNEKNYEVVLESIRVQGQIPPFTNARIEGDSIVTDCDVLNFLGVSGFRPIPDEGIQAPYTIEYDKVDGSHIVLIGEFDLHLYPGDISASECNACDFNSDGIVNSLDVSLIEDYVWNGNRASYPAEAFDINGDGNVDVLDFLEVLMSAER